MSSLYSLTYTNRQDLRSWLNLNRFPVFTLTTYRRKTDRDTLLTTISTVITPETTPEPRRTAKNPIDTIERKTTVITTIPPEFLT